MSVEMSTNGCSLCVPAGMEFPPTLSELTGSLCLAAFATGLLGSAEVGVVTFSISPVPSDLTDSEVELSLLVSLFRGILHKVFRETLLYGTVFSRRLAVSLPETLYSTTAAILLLGNEKAAVVIATSYDEQMNKNSLESARRKRTIFPCFPVCFWYLILRTLYGNQWSCDADEN